MILRHAHCNHDTTGIHSAREKKLLAQRLKEAAANLMGVIPCTVSVSVKDLSIENWDDFIKELPDDEIVIPETYN